MKRFVIHLVVGIAAFSIGLSAEWILTIDQHTASVPKSPEVKPVALNINELPVPVSVTLPVPELITAREVPEHKLPRPIRLKLDRRFPGWHFAQISDEIRQATTEWVSPGSQLDLVKGDFDGNGKLDYALLIEHGEIFNNDGAAIGRNAYIVAFLRKGNDYKFHLVDSYVGDYLMLIKKGDGRYDYEAQKEFT